MLLYADCANIETLKKMDELGVLSGITTNPAILARESAPPAATIANICRAFPGYPVFAQANAMDCGGMVEMAVAYAAISPRVVVKIPACVEGFRAFHKIRAEKLFDNEICITTVTTAAQALLASAAAPTTSPPMSATSGRSATAGWTPSTRSWPSWRARIRRSSPRRRNARRT